MSIVTKTTAKPSLHLCSEHFFPSSFFHRPWSRKSLSQGWFLAGLSSLYCTSVCVKGSGKKWIFAFALTPAAQALSGKQKLSYWADIEGHISLKWTLMYDQHWANITLTAWLSVTQVKWCDMFLFKAFMLHSMSNWGIWQVRHLSGIIFLFSKHIKTDHLLKACIHLMELSNFWYIHTVMPFCAIGTNYFPVLA